MFKQPATLTAAVRRAVVKALIVFLIPCAVAVGIGLSHTLVAPPAMGHGEAHDVLAGTPDAVWAKHGSTCWTGAQPSDVYLPGHVIAAHAGGAYHYSKALVGPAMAQQFNGENHNLTIYAFCR